MYSCSGGLLSMIGILYFLYISDALDALYGIQTFIILVFMSVHQKKNDALLMHLMH